MGRGTARRVVEGVRPKRADHHDDPVNINQNVRSSYTKHLIPILFHEFVPAHIALWISAPIMHFAIDFNDQLEAAAVKVGDIAADRVLSPEL
jgi:hypothetical protein